MGPGPGPKSYRSGEPAAVRALRTPRTHVQAPFPPSRLVTPLSEPEALVAVAYCAAYADGAMGAEEDARLDEHLSECRALQRCDPATLDAARRKVARLASEEGDAALLSAAAQALPQPMRETAFCLAADITLADGDIAEEERAFIGRLRKELQVEESLASRIVEVVLIRNRA